MFLPFLATTFQPETLAKGLYYSLILDKILSKKVGQKKVKKTVLSIKKKC